MTDLPPPADRRGFELPPPPPTPPPASGTVGQVAGDAIGSLGRYAGFWRRMGAYLLDALLYGLLISPFVMMAYLSALRGNDRCFSLGGEVVEVVCPPDGTETGPRVVTLVIGVIGTLVVVAIYLRALGPAGQTWGCRIARVRVVRKHTGGPIGFGRALGRQLFALTTLSLLLGYLWMLWDDERQTWHDKIADTVVVET